MTHKEKCKEYYLKNAEKIKKQRKEYYKNNSEKMLEHTKEYLKNNPQKRKKYNKKYYKSYYIPVGTKGSRGEKAIHKICDSLTEQGIIDSYQKEWSHPNIKHERLLRFDVAIFVAGEKYLIEFNGRQHYEPVAHFGDFLKTKIRDAIKIEGCQREGIPLLVIKYDEDIEEKMVEFLIKYGIIRE